MARIDKRHRPEADQEAAALTSLCGDEVSTSEDNVPRSHTPSCKQALSGALL